MIKMFCDSLKGLYLFLILTTSCQSRLPEERMLEKGIQFLLAQQAEDGGWHSQQHGLLKGGQAYTPFVLDALLEAQESDVHIPPDKIDRALHFIRRLCDEEGVLGRNDPQILEYPNYATAYALKVLSRLNQGQDQALIRKMQTYLIGQQFVDSWMNRQHPAYGGWGFGETNLGPGFVGHVDLSNTRKILESLRESGFEMEQIRKNTRIFLDLCQHKGIEEVYDGGFYYSPVLMATNKAGKLSSGDSNYARSYATATSDGVLALLALGVSQKDKALQDARQWLLENESWDLPAGIPKDQPQDWGPTIRIYHLAVRAESYQALGIKGDWKNDLLLNLEVFQREDGSFANPAGARNKENDPILATTLALKALLAARN